MTELSDSVTAGAHVIADALCEQKPSVVVVPFVMSGAADMSDEQWMRMAQMMRQAFEEALK